MNKIIKIKLLIITPSLECGGAEQYVANICNAIDKNKFDVTLLVINNSNPFYTIENDIKIVDLKKKKSSIAILKILQFIKQNNFDIAYTTANHLNLLLVIFKNFIPKSTALIAWETSIVSINHKYSSFPKIYNFLLKRFYKKLPLVICQSNFMQQDLMDNYGFVANQLQVIYTGINKPLIEIDTTVQDLPLFLTVARLSPEKRIDKILSALALLLFDFKYTIIGDGTERKKLEQHVAQYKLSDKVVFMGQLPNPYQHVQSANLFLMFSQYEGLPTTLLEATALGIPVIAYNSPGGIAEIIENGVNGFLVEDNNEEMYAKTIEKALRHSFNKSKIIEHTLAKFEANKSMKQLEDVFYQTATNSI